MSLTYGDDEDISPSTEHLLYSRQRDVSVAADCRLVEIEIDVASYRVVDTEEPESICIRETAKALLSCLKSITHVSP